MGEMCLHKELVRPVSSNGSIQQIQSRTWIRSWNRQAVGGLGGVFLSGFGLRSKARLDQGKFDHSRPKPTELATSS